MMSINIIFTISIYFTITGNGFGEEFNLFGEAGQAYAIQMNIGHPHQKLNVVLDTGSTTLAVASYARVDNNKYFHAHNSSSLYDSGKEVQSKYSQGMWIGRLASDFVQFPSLPMVPEVRSDMALITSSHDFFMKGFLDWEGLLGLAYPPVGTFGDNLNTESWLDSVDRTLNKPMSFEFKLCGIYSTANTTHYGNFKMLDDNSINKNYTLRTPVLRKRWYEVAVLSVRVVTTNIEKPDDTSDTDNSIQSPDYDMCTKLNQDNCIVDSGTTNIKLPDLIFRQVVNELRNAARSSNILILDEFWDNDVAACWPEPQQFSLPRLAIDLLSAESDNQYFTIEIAPENYMRMTTTPNTNIGDGTIGEYCYKLGLQAGGKETVLGYTAMEGLQVLFNRSGGWIGWQASDCGPNSRVTGPFNTSKSFMDLCRIRRSRRDMEVSIKAAQWALCALSIIAGAVLIYLLAPCVKTFLVRRLPVSTQISLSQAALVDQEST